MNIFSEIDNEVEGNITADMRKQWGVTRDALSLYNKRGEDIGLAQDSLSEARQQAAELITAAELNLRDCMDMSGDAEVDMLNQWESLRDVLGDEYYDDEPYALEYYVE